MTIPEDFDLNLLSLDVSVREDRDYYDRAEFKIKVTVKLLYKGEEISESTDSLSLRPHVSFSGPREDPW